MNSKIPLAAIFLVSSALAASAAAEDPKAMPALETLDQLSGPPAAFGGPAGLSANIFDGNRSRSPQPGLPGGVPLSLRPIGTAANAWAVQPVNRGLASVLGIPAIKAVYALDKAMAPYDDFTRDVVRSDPRPLSEQAAQMQKDIRERFLVDDGRLFLYEKPMSMGDMNIWQGAYTTMAILKYTWDDRRSAPETDESQAYAEKAFDGLAMMYKKGLPLARGVLPAGMSNLSETDRWHHQDADHQWVEDASLDSTSGWLLGVIMAERSLPSRREQARELLRQFADDLIANGFALKNSDGSKTRFGNLGHGPLPPPPGVLMSIAALNQVAQDFPDQKYNEALDKFARDHKDVWAAYAGTPTLWRNNTTNDNMGVLALASALLTEKDSERWLYWAHGMVKLVQAYEKGGNSFWIYISYWALEQRPDMLMMHGIADGFLLKNSDGGNTRFGNLGHGPVSPPPGLLMSISALNPDMLMMHGLDSGMAGMSEDKLVSDWLARRGELMALAKKPMQEFDYPGCKQAYETRNSIRKDVKFAKWPIKGQKTLAQPLPFCDPKKGGACQPPADFAWQRSRWAMDDWVGFKDKPAFEFTGMDYLFAYYLGLHDGAIQPEE